MESLQKRWNDWISSFKKKDASGGDEKANIKSAQIVFVFGPEGTGKTFSGDYMDIIHGYHHVDGDIPVKHIVLVPEYKEMMEKVAFTGDFTPFQSEIARLTIEAAKKHDKVVLSHATHKNEERDYIVKKLIEGGASKDNITLIQLTIDPRVKARGLYYRMKRYAEESDTTIEDLIKSQGFEFEGEELTEEIFVEVALQEEAKRGSFVDDHPDAIMVDVSGRDISHFDNIDKALGLTRSSDLTYENICAKVKPIDLARDKKVMENGYLEAMADIHARAAAKRGDNSLVIDEEGKDEKEVNEMKKRRSSLVQLEQSLRSLSISIRGTSDGVEIHRKSLIETGKIGAD